MNFQDRIITILLEHEAYRDTKAKDYDPYAGPLARKYGKTRMSKAKKPKDPVVHAGVSDAVKRLNKKLGGAKTNPQLQHMVQSALLARRKKFKGKGLDLPPLSAQDSAALGEREREMPGDKERASRRRRGRRR